MAEGAAVATAGLTLDVTPALLRADRDNHQTGDKERNDDWADYTSDLLNMLEMLPEIHRNKSIRVRYVCSPQTPKSDTNTSPILTRNKRFGDDVQTVPYRLFTKARTIGDECALVLPLNYDRHFGPAFNRLLHEKDGFMDFPFLDKIAKVNHFPQTLPHEKSIPVTHILPSFPRPPMTTSPTPPPMTASPMYPLPSSLLPLLSVSYFSPFCV
jgi:hypothetical protein